MLKDFAKKIGYDDPLEICISKLESLLPSDYKISKRSIALLVLQEDREILDAVKEKEGGGFDAILGVIQEAKAHYTHPLSYIIGLRRQQESSRISKAVMDFKGTHKLTLRERMSKILMNPITGGPILLAVLYYGLYKFVGIFGAGVLI